MTELKFEFVEIEKPGRAALPAARSAGAADAAELAYQKAKRAYRRIVGKTMGGLGPKKGEFLRLVEEHGEELVVRAVQVWAEELGPDRCRMLRWPLALFLTQADEFVEAARGSDEGKSGWNTAQSIVPESWRPGKQS
jgi:hypothetical protein